MNKKVVSYILGAVVLIVIGGVAWYFLAGGYHPKAYMVISEIQYGDGNFRHQIHSIHTFGMEVDLLEGYIDTFPLDVRVPTGFNVNPAGTLLYMTGKEGRIDEVDDNYERKWSLENPPKRYDIRVYDLNTKRLKKTIELPDDADDYIGSINFSPDGSRLFISNPYENVEDAPTQEKQKKRWVLDAQSGEFLFGYNFAGGPYMAEDGSKAYSLGGRKDGVIEPGFTAVDIENDTVITAYSDFDRLMEEHGGLHIEGFEFGYPHMEGRKPLIFYDRDTYEEIDRLDLTEGLGPDDKLRISLPQPDKITKNKKYLVVYIGKEIEGYKRYEHYLRLVNIQDREIENTIKIWEGSGKILGPAVH